jgi:hypothetical protein
MLSQGALVFIKAKQLESIASRICYHNGRVDGVKNWSRRRKVL